jgi:hypothetical protein
VPLSYQGRAFALQSTLKSGAAIVPLLTLGAAASVFSVEQVLLVSPLVLLLIAFGLVQVSFVFSEAKAPRGLDVLSTFWLESEEPVAPPDEREVSGLAPAP